MWLMLQQDQPDDFVIGTGISHSVQDFVETAFEHAGLDWRDYLRIDPQLYRPADVELLQADAGKARRILGWEPTVQFEELVQMMVETDLALVGDQELRPTKTSTNGYFHPYGRQSGNKEAAIKASSTP